MIITVFSIAACSREEEPTPVPEGPSPDEPAIVEEVAFAATVPIIDFETPVEIPLGAVNAVDVIGAWVEAGAPESEAFDYVGYDGQTYQGDFSTDILPLFTQPNRWYSGSPACSSCPHGNLETSYHEMDLSSYEGIMAGADRLEDPPGEPLLG